MSDQLPSHDSLPQSLTEFNPSQDNLDNTDEADNPQDSLTKSGFKRRALIHQSSDALSEIEKNGVTWLPDTSEQPTFKESMQSDFMVSNSPEKGSFSGMGFQPAEYSSLQTLKCIINEAKQAERYMFSGEEHHYEVDNYMKVHFSDENEVREYFLEDDITFDRMPTSIKKTENQGLVIDFTGEAVEKENEDSKATVLTNDALGHSKSSYIAGPVRYSKMPEEEAASIFEQRRKELLDSLAKKGKRKNLRIFQDNDPSTARLTTGGENQMSSPKEKSTVPGFVIFNTGKSNSNQLRGAESPSSAKKDRQKDSMLRKSLTSARSPKPQTQPVWMSQSREKKDFSSPKEFSSPIAINKDNVIKTRPPPEKREVTKKEPVSTPIVKTIVKDLKSPKREEMSPTKILVDVKTLKHSSTNKTIKNSARDTAMTEEDRKARRETLTRINETEYDREIKNADIVPPKQLAKGKNKEILADIEELDQQIQQLEESKASIDKTREQINNSSVYSEQASRGDSKAMFKRKAKEEIPERMPLYRNERLPSENESPGKGIPSDRYKLDSVDFLIETETDNVYKRYLSERSQAESPVINYRKSPNQDESSLNIYSQSYRSQNNDRRLSNPGEYLYQKALEKKETRQQQIERRQREKEMMELSACTFTPNLRPLETSEDFETRSKNWQNQKEKKLHEIEKHNMEKEMAECTFYPSTSRKTGPVKFDPNDFYTRNIEWKKKIETEDAEKQIEMARTMTMSSENKSLLNTTNNSSSKTPQNMATAPKADSQYSNKGYSKALNLGNKKPNEPETIKVFSLTSDTHRAKMRPSDVQSPNLCTIEDDFSHRRRSDQIKRPTLENFVSTDLKDLLKRTNYKSDKNETTKSKGTSPNKMPKDLHLNTSKGRESQAQPNHPVILTTLRDSFPAKKSPASQNGTPLGFTDNFSKSVKNNAESSQAKGNKYYLSRKPKQVDSATVPTQQDAFSLDKKDPVMSAGYSNQSRKQSSKLAPGAYQLMQGSKVDQENRQFKKKPLSKGQTTSYASMELSEDQLFYCPEENRVPLGTRQSNQYTDDYMRRITSKDIASNFEKDFIEFVTSAGKEKQPSDKNVSPDGDLSKKRRTNLSLQ